MDLVSSKPGTSGMQAISTKDPADVTSVEPAKLYLDLCLHRMNRERPGPASRDDNGTLILVPGKSRRAKQPIPTAIEFRCEQGQPDPAAAHRRRRRSGPGNLWSTRPEFRSSGSLPHHGKLAPAQVMLSRRHDTGEVAALR